jgi:hypothetical protein
MAKKPTLSFDVQPGNADPVTGTPTFTVTRIVNGKPDFTWEDHPPAEVAIILQQRLLEEHGVDYRVLMLEAANGRHAIMTLNAAWCKGLFSFDGNKNAFKKAGSFTKARMESLHADYMAQRGKAHARAMRRIAHSNPQEAVA